VWAASLAGALTASTVHSLTIEKLHFRHFWLMLALLWALTSHMEHGTAPATEPRRRS
jgi:hypothetical protein